MASRVKLGGKRQRLLTSQRYTPRLHFVCTQHCGIQERLDPVRLDECARVMQLMLRRRRLSIRSLSGMSITAGWNACRGFSDMRTDEAYMLYAGALSYADGALIISQRTDLEGRDCLILPTHTLIGLAIEMAFKAVYLHKGGDPGALRKHDIRHGLQELRSLASNVEFNTKIPGIGEIVDHIGANYARHEYRYLKSGKELNKINILAALPSVLQFLDEVAVVIGVPPRPGAVH